MSEEDIKAGLQKPGLKKGDIAGSEYSDDSVLRKDPDLFYGKS